MASSLARRLFSSSVTYVRRSTGSHLHQINGYTLLAQTSIPGDAVRSKPFYVGGRRFQLLLYPNGITADHRGSLSADLKLAYDDYDDLDLPQRWHKATATYRVSIVDNTGNKLVRISRTVGPCRFITPGYDRRYIYGLREEEDDEIVKRKTSVDELVAANELRRSAPMVLGDDDCLQVWCDVAVLDTESKWWRNSWCMRLERALHSLGLY